MTRLNYEHNGSKKLDSKMSLLSYRVSDFILFNISFCLPFRMHFKSSLEGRLHISTSFQPFFFVAGRSSVCMGAKLVIV